MKNFSSKGCELCALKKKCPNQYHNEQKETIVSNMNDKNISHEKPVSARNQVASKCNDNNYHALFEQATDAIMVTDFNGNFIDVNSSLCTMFGYTKEELLQLNVKALLDCESLKM